MKLVMTYVAVALGTLTYLVHQITIEPHDAGPEMVSPSCRDVLCMTSHVRPTGRYFTAAQFPDQYFNQYVLDDGVVHTGRTARAL